MRALITALFAFICRRARTLRLIFLSVVLVCVGYYETWQLWGLPELPGRAMVSGSLPWSWPWFEFGFRSDLMSLHTYDVISLIVVAIGFGLNCTIASGIVLWLWYRARS